MSSIIAPQKIDHAAAGEPTDDQNRITRNVADAQNLVVIAKKDNVRLREEQERAYIDAPANPARINGRTAERRSAIFAKSRLRRLEVV